jgi:eukaryotic-like serine/threonine-protein kinase
MELAQTRRLRENTACAVQSLSSRQGATPNSLREHSVQSGTRERLQDLLGDAYEIQSELPQGGMSRLFLAIERSLHRRVVVKVLPPELASEVSIARFQREIALTAQLQHPHVLPILSTGGRAELLYYIAPYVEGESLRHRLSRDASIPLDDALRLIREIADALAYAHSRGVVHRDVKPENILLQGDHALLADFGIASAIDTATDQSRLTGTGMGLGTPCYMAPEQVLAGQLTPDARSDIYALGVVAYEILTGLQPFPDRSSPHAIVAQLNTAPPPVATLRRDVPVSVSAAITRALSLSPNERQSTAAEFREAIRVSDPAVESRRVATRVKLHGMIAAAILVAILIAATGYLERGRLLAALPGNGFSSRTNAFGPANAVAVLPLENLGSGPSDQYFSDGMTEDLITALSKVRGLRVAARTSAFSFTRNNPSLPDIARQLHVSSIVEGSVRRADKRLRVSARLVNPQTGYEEWSENYDRTPEDIFAVQDEIARAIASAIGKMLDDSSNASRGDTFRTPLLAASPAHLVRAPTRDIQAYDLYLQARAMREQRGAVALHEAITLLSAAIQRDSAFASAYAALALTYAILPAYTSVPEDSVDPLIEKYATRALKLDSASTEAETALGNLAAEQWRWKDAESHLRRAISLDSSSAPAHLTYAILLRSEGRFAASLREHAVAESLDPLSPPVAWNKGITLLNAGMFEQASQAGHRAIQLSPNSPNGYWVLVAAKAFGGQFDSAVELMNRLAPQLSAGDDLLMAAFIYGTTGHKQVGEDYLQRARTLPLSASKRAQSAAFAQLALGHRDSALTWVATSIRLHESVWADDFALCHKAFDVFRRDPRFIRETAKLGLPPCEQPLTH